MNARAVYAVEKGTVRVNEFAVDEAALAPDEVLVRTHYTLISPGTELDCISGRESSWFKFPQQLGYCAAGEVVAAGGEVSRYAVGDRVLTPTPHASQVVIDEGAVRGKVPDGVYLIDALWAHIALIAITALRVSRAELGDTAVVVGQGLIGNLAAQLFRAQGCRVIAVDRLAPRLETARQCGIEAVVSSSIGSAVSAVRELTHGVGAEIVIEATGSAAAALEAAQMAARNSELILLGTPRGSYQADIVPLLRAIHVAKENITIKGAHTYSLPQLPDEFMKHSMGRNAEILLGMIQRSEIEVGPLMSMQARPEDAPAVYRQLRDQPEQVLGVVFDWTA